MGDMEDGKPAVTSTTMQGAFAALAGAVITILHAPEITLDLVAPQVMVILGSVLAIFGRWNANKTITGIFS